MIALRFGIQGGIFFIRCLDWFIGSNKGYVTPLDLAKEPPSNGVRPDGMGTRLMDRGTCPQWCERSWKKKDKGRQGS